MNPLDYISFLTSVVLALGITCILTGVGRILQLRSLIRVYWVQYVVGASTSWKDCPFWRSSSQIAAASASSASWMIKVSIIAKLE